MLRRLVKEGNDGGDGGVGGEGDVEQLGSC